MALGCQTMKTGASLSPAVSSSAAARVENGRQLEHSRDVRLVLLSQFRHMRRGGDIVIAIRHAETALEKVSVAARWVFQPLRHPHPEKVPGFEVGVVQSIDIGAQTPAQRAGQSVPVRNRRDLRQLRFERFDALGFYGGLIHETGVVIADFPGVGVSRGGCFGHLLDQSARARPRLVGQYREDAIASLVGGNGCGFQPAAVGVGVEIVARRHGLVHPRQVDSRPERRRSLPASGRCGESNGEDDHREQTCRGNFPILHVLRVSQFQFANTITYCRASIPYSLAVAAPGEAAFGAAPPVSQPLCALETSVFALTSWAEIQHTPNRREVRHEDPARYLEVYR